MTHGSLFSGIGGFDLAAEWAGIPTLWQVEKDAKARAVLQKNFPDARRYDDVFNFDEHDNRNRVDIVSGGFPCQPFSVAGKRKGTGDDRHLWPRMLEIITGLQPSWVVAENVPGLLTIEDGVVFESVCSDLESAGYTVWPVIIPACAVGAWHRRDRIWIVANAKRNGLEGPRNSAISGGETIHIADRNSDLADSESGRDVRRERELGDVEKKHQFGRGEENGSWERWEAEPSVGRVVDGIPGRVDRIRQLGNAIVPQVAYQIFQAILECENYRRKA